MIEVYLSLNGNGREVAQYYAELFETEAPYLMGTRDMPEEEQAQMGGADILIYGNVRTFAGDIMLSDRMPGEPKIQPNDAVWITLSHKDQSLIRRSFERLAKDGEILMPLEPTFFSPLYGQVRDKFGFCWMLMDPGDM